MRPEGTKMDISVLYAEDEALTRQVFCEVLATKVRTVYQAANGKEGLAMFMRYRPDVALIDNNMPHMDGLSLARALQEIVPTLPIVIVSGDIKRQNLLQVEHMKLCFIKKPIRIRELLGLLQQLTHSIPSSNFPAAHPVPAILS